MPQIQLPMFPNGSIEINDSICAIQRDGEVTYFYGHIPMYSHGADDLASFRYFTSQMIHNGSVSIGEIQRAFRVSPTTIKRYLAKFRKDGAEGIFVKPKPRTGHKLNEETLAKARALLEQGKSVPDVSKETGVIQDTLRKAIQSGRLPQAQKKNASLKATHTVAGTQTTRIQSDINEPLGFATARNEERIFASFGLINGVKPVFTHEQDVHQAGVLLALPALLAQGLLTNIRKFFHMREGFYRMESIFMLLAFLAMLRCSSLEKLRYCRCGELGRLLGLDRCPEVKTLREKLSQICNDDGKAEEWSGERAKNWMGEQDEQAHGFFYVDGHIRVYYGEQTQLPRQYVCRQKLCLRGVSDYWVGGFGGHPFFVITAPVNPGMIKMLRETIVPRLLNDIPNQPTQELLDNDPDLPRFTLVFDREGWSPDLFAELWQQRIAILTYKKSPGEPWPPEQFQPTEVSLSNGEKVEMSLSERGVQLSNAMWTREIRKRSDCGHQTTIVTTHKKLTPPIVASRMFARWCQENFFKYMAENYGLNKLSEHATEPIPETTMVVNPAWRKLDQTVRRETTKLTRMRSEFNAQELTAEGQVTQKQLHTAGTLLEDIKQLEGKIKELKAQRKSTPRHIAMKDLPEDQQFQQLRKETKHFVNTIKMIAYRAETALANILSEHLSHPDTVRTLLRQIFESPANLIPDEKNQTLTVQLHPPSLACHTQAITALCTELTQTETVFPDSNLRLIFEILGPS